jgi:hypothetical protein
MKFIQLTFGLTALALGIASAASSYRFTLNEPLWFGGTQLKAGEYKVEMRADKAVIKIGKTVVEVPATLGKSDRKYTFTSFLSQGSKIIEIDLGGTSDRIVINPEAQTAAGSK